MNHFSYLELLTLVAPETILVVAALVVLAVDVLFLRNEPLRNRFWICAGFACLGCVVAIGWLLTMNMPPHSAEVFAVIPMLKGMFVDDMLVRWVQVGLLVLTLLTVVISTEARFTEHVGEYLALLLLATVGMMFLAGSEDLLMIFISLELTSLSLYILTAFNKKNVKSAEAALKYFLFGGMSAAFTLFGLSFVYGLAGTTNLRDIATKLGGPGLDPLLIVALVMTVIGFGFKVAAAPFHLWAPDAYQGAPTPSAALIASGSKVASFFIFAKVMMLAFGPASGSGAWHAFATGWLPVLALVAALSMLLGNFTAIAQSNVKRLLAYSAIAHGGYALLGIIANGPLGISSLVYYAVTYGLTVLGAFGVAGIVEDRTGDARLTDFAGFGKREPWLAFCMLIFMLSLAGIPPLAGFFGKFYLFTAAVAGAKDLGMIWLVIFAIAMSAVSLYYYLQVLKQIYVAKGPEVVRGSPSALTSRVVLGLVALSVVGLGCAPDLFVGKLVAAVKLAGF